MRICSWCEGTGKRHYWIQKDCHVCSGHGELYNGTQEQLDEYDDEELEDMGLLVRCNNCYGSGSIEIESIEDCQACNGTGQRE